MEGHPWIFPWELHQHLIPYQRDGLNFSKVMMHMDIKQQGPSICFISVGNEMNCHQINCSFQVTSINHQHTGREEKDPRVKQFKIRAGMCFSKSLLIFTSLLTLLSCATTQQGPGGCAMEQERIFWPKSELQFKGTAPPSHVHTGFDSRHL